MFSRSLRRLLPLLARPATHAVALKGGTLVLGYATHILLGRWLGVEGFGLYAVALAVASVLAALGGSGVGETLHRFYLTYQSRGMPQRAAMLVAWGRRRVWGWSAFWTLLALAGWALFFPDAPAVLPALVAIPLFAALALEAEVSRVHGHVRLPFLPAPLRHVLLLGAGGLLAWMGRSDVASFLVLTGGIATVVWAWVRWQNGAEWAPAPEKRLRTLWVRSSAMLWLTGTLYLVHTQVDLLLVGFVVSAHEAGLYRAASRTAALLDTLIVTVNLIVAPRLALHFAQKDRAGLQHLLRKGVVVVAALVLPFSALAVWQATPLLGLFGEDFQAATPLFVVLLLAQVGAALCGMALGLLNVTGHARASGVALLLATLTQSLLGRMVAPVWGAMGVAWVTFFCMLGLKAGLAVYAWRVLGVRTDLGAVFSRS